MFTYLLYKNVRLHSELFEAGEVVEYNLSLDPTIAMEVKDHDGIIRKLSLIDWVYVYDDKKSKQANKEAPATGEPTIGWEGGDTGNDWDGAPATGEPTDVKPVQKSKK